MRLERLITTQRPRRIRNYLMYLAVTGEMKAGWGWHQLWVICTLYPPPRERRLQAQPNCTNLLDYMLSWMDSDIICSYFIIHLCTYVYVRYRYNRDVSRTERVSSVLVPVVRVLAGRVVLRCRFMRQIEEEYAGQRRDEEYDVEPSVVETELQVTKHLRNYCPVNIIALIVHYLWSSLGTDAD